MDRLQIFPVIKVNNFYFPNSPKILEVTVGDDP